MNALSYSSLSTFGNCALRFSREKKIQVREPNYSEKSARGTIIHRFMEEVCSDYLLRGKWIKVPDAADLMKDLWSKGFPTKEDEKKNIIEVVEWDLDFYEKSIEDSILLVPQIYEEIIPYISPAQVESYITLPMTHPGKTYTHIHGVIDLVNTNNSIIDWKTSTSVRRQDMLEYDMQATIYAALSEMPKVDVHFVQMIFLKRNTPRIEWQTTKRDTRHTKWLMETYLPAVVKQIETENLPPNPGWHCAGCGVQCGVNPNVEEYIVG